MSVLNTDLLAACWTSAGDTGPLLGDELSPLDLRSRIEAVGRIGWKGFGLFHKDLILAKESMGLQTLARILADNGIEHVEMEFLANWWTDGQTRAESDAVRRHILDSAAELGVRTVKVGADLGASPAPFGRYVEEFAVLANEAGEAGTRVAVEPMPMANIRTIHDGIKLVTEAGSAFGGLCVDIWHVARAGTPFDEMAAALPLDKLFVVELDDAVTEVVGSLWDDTIDGRRYCGEGDLDVTSFINEIRSVGWTGHWGVEILSTEHRALPIEEGLQRAFDTTQGALALADKTYLA